MPRFIESSTSEPRIHSVTCLDHGSSPHEKPTKRAWSASVNSIAYSWFGMVAVGTALAGGPPQDPYLRRYRIRLLPWVFGEEAVVWIGMQDSGAWKPASGDLPKASPWQAMSLTPAP